MQSVIPLNEAAPAQFARAREFLRAARFDETTLCRVLGLDDMSGLGRVAWEKLKPPGDVPQADASAGLPVEGGGEGMSGALGWCLQVFVRGLAITEEESRRVCGRETLEAFLGLGLLRQSSSRPEALVCPVWVYPADGWVMVSDRRDDPEGGSYTPPADVVFPAIYPGTLRFLALLPAQPGDALDLCGGSGIGALHLSRTARTAVSADITERSAAFARFNARLNGVTVESLCGDLYEPAAGRQFDLITAHPPFVPATGPNMVYRDAGAAGDEVTRRIIEGLPGYLRPGGTCVVLSVARDTEETFELRARNWLGATADQFDLVFGLEKVLETAEVVESMRKRSQQMAEEEARQLLARLESLGTRQFVYGALFVRRCPGSIPDRPLRIRMTHMATAADFERVFAWRANRRSPGFHDWLARSRPRLAPGLELTARHVVREGELVPAEFVFSIRARFEAALRPDAWVVPLLARLEGKRSVEEIYRQARDAGDLPKGFPLEDFLSLVQGMIERGFLQLD